MTDGHQCNLSSTRSPKLEEPPDRTRRTVNPFCHSEPSHEDRHQRTLIVPRETIRELFLLVGARIRLVSGFTTLGFRPSSGLTSKEFHPETNRSEELESIECLTLSSRGSLISVSAYLTPER